MTSEHSASELREAQKAAAAAEAAKLVTDGAYIGVGTGSTVAHFIEALMVDPFRYIAGAVATSADTEARLAAVGIPIYDLSVVGRLPIYVDGADEIDPELRMIKGAGGAMTREKICAAASDMFICIADESKYTGNALGAAPVPVEVIPMAHGLVVDALRKMGGEPEPREEQLTDGGNTIIDCPGLDLSDPERLEYELEVMPGVVGSGVFARRGADVAFIGTPEGVTRITPAE